MIKPARVALVANRWTPFAYVIAFEGVDLTGAVLHMQVRQQEDAAGLPIIDMGPQSDPTAPGVRLLPTDTSGPVPISYVRLQIPDEYLRNGNFPAGAEPGDDARLSWDLLITLPNRTRARWLYGDFLVRAGTTQLDPAPLADDPVPGAPDAIVRVDGEALRVEVTATVLVAAAAAEAKAARDEAVVNAAMRFDQLAIEGPQVLVDDAGTIGPAHSVYLGLGARFYDPLLGAIVAQLANPESDLPGYVRLSWPDSNSALHLIVDGRTGLAEILVFTELPARLAASPGRIYVLASRWGRAATLVTALGYRRADQRDAVLAARDASNLARSAAMREPGQVTHVQRPIAGHNLLMLSGQSLGAGQEAWPALSKTAFGGNKMVGGAATYKIRLDDYPTLLGGTYPTFGAATLTDLVAVNIADYHDTILTNAATAALPAGNAAFAEMPIFGWANGAKALLNQHLLTTNDAARTIVGMASAVSGQNIERYLPGGNGAFYALNLDGAAKAKAAAGAGPFVVLADTWMQGEFNYFDPGGLPGVDTTRAGYVASLNTLIAAKRADYMALTGQTLPPAFYTYQTGGGFTRDLDGAGNPGLAIGMAQLDVALSRDDIWMVGPVYPVTDKGGHLDANGSRWFGHQIAKVMHRVQVVGREWEPVRPIRIERDGTRVVIDFHVPAPPLAFAQPYVLSAATTIADKGFRVTDASGVVPLSSVTLIGATQVEVVLGRATVGQAHVWYAHEAAGGAGMLRDSDAAVATDRYVYAAGSGMYPAANIAALIDKPYPLQNWCVAFYLPAGFGV